MVINYLKKLKKQKLHLKKRPPSTQHLNRLYLPLALTLPASTSPKAGLQGQRTTLRPIFQNFPFEFHRLKTTKKGFTKTYFSIIKNNFEKLFHQIPGLNTPTHCIQVEKSPKLSISQKILGVSILCRPSEKISKPQKVKFQYPNLPRPLITSSQGPTNTSPTYLDPCRPTSDNYLKKLKKNKNYT